ncbi:MAG: ABC transporter ATP-binding protein [Deltaproteobacteria bacterium]|jgi:lipoprotein-releasing system ATP-binding protein|nr:ABC transporter ATP-binding protein [Deltaproteobacteria bacterium]
MEIEAKNLGMFFNDGGRRIELFEGLNLQVQQKESLAILGSSGSGKTTLLYILGGLEQPTSGEVWLGGINITSLQMQNKDLFAVRRKSVGFVFQFHQLLQEFNALENVALPLLIQGRNKNEVFDKAEKMLLRVGLQDRLTHRPGQLSGGEQQRVAIARALVAKPGIILADEPTGNLDKKNSDEVAELLLELQREEESSLIVVTHSLDIAKKMERVLELVNMGVQEIKI